MAFFHARRRAAIATVTSGTTKFFGIVNLQQLFTGVTDEGCCELVGLLPGTAGRHVRSFDYEWLARAEVTNLATIHDAVLVDVNLMTENCVIEAILVFCDQVIDVF